MKAIQSVTGRVGRAAVASNAVVLGAIVAVALGIGVALRIQLSLPLPAAMATTIFAGSLMLLFHIAFMRGKRIAELEKEIAELWSAIGAVPAEIKRMTGVAAEQGKRPVHARGRSAPAVVAPQPRRILAEEAGEQPQNGEERPSDLTLAEETALARAMAEPDMRNAPPLVKPKADISRGKPEPLPDLETSAESAIEDSVRALRSTSLAMRARPERSRPDAAHREMTRAALSQADDEAVAGETGTERHVPQPTAAAEAQSGDEHVSAQRATTEPSEPRTEPSTGLEDRLSELADALAADRIDMLLQPILGLKDQVARHFEVSIALRAADGAALSLDVDQTDLVGTGILPLIDLAKLTRVAELARRLAERGRSGAVFTGLSGESLADDDVLARVSEIHHARAAITDQLVIAIPQHDVRGFTPAHWSIVQELCGSGFRFALAYVDDLDMDFEQMRRAGIQYVKLDADIFLGGLPAGEDLTIPAADVYGFLADKGLSLIVDHIDSEPQLMKVVENGALYGQGQLFGGPRPVKAEVFASRSAA